MCFKMMKIGVFRVLLFLGGEMYQQIETAELRIAAYDRGELLFVEQRKLRHCFGEFLEQTLVFLTIVDAFLFRSPRRE